MKETEDGEAGSVTQARHEHLKGNEGRFCGESLRVTVVTISGSSQEYPVWRRNSKERV